MSPIEKLRDAILTEERNDEVVPTDDLLRHLDAFAAEWEAGRIELLDGGDDPVAVLMPLDYNEGAGVAPRIESGSIVLAPRTRPTLREAAEELFTAVAEILPPASMSTRLENAHARLAAALAKEDV